MEIPRERVDHPLERAVLDPPLKAPMTGLVGRIANRQVLPRGAGAENPENAVQDISGIAPRTAPSIATETRLRQQRREYRPLGVGEVHTAEYDGRSYFVHGRPFRFMR